MKKVANSDEDVIIENLVSIDMDLDSGDVGIEGTLTGGKLIWKIYCYNENDVDRLNHNLIDTAVDEVRIRMIASSKFYDL